MNEENKVIWHPLPEDPPPEDGFYLITETFEDGTEEVSIGEWRFAFSKIGVCGVGRSNNPNQDYKNSFSKELCVPADGFYDIAGAFVSDSDFKCVLLKHVTHWAYKPLSPSGQKGEIYER